MSKKLALGVFGFGLLLFGLRDLAGWASLGRSFTPFSAGTSISASVWDESGSYAPPLAALITRGQIYADDIKENREFPLPLPLLHAVVLAPVAKVLGMELTWSIARVIFPALTLTFFFFIFSTTMTSVPARLLLSLAACTIPFAPRNMFLVGQFSLIQPLELSRFSNPSFSFCLLLGFLLLLKRFLDSGERRFGIGAGLALGLMSYSYYYYSVALAVGFGLFWLLLGLKKEIVWFRRLSVVIAVSALVALPYAFTLVKAQAYIGQTLIPRVGLFSNRPDFAGVILFFLAAALARWDFLKSRTITYRLFFLLLLCGAGFGLNLQTLTGYSAQHEHYWNRLVQPAGFAFLLCVISQFISMAAFPLPAKAAASAVVVLLATLTALSGYRQLASFTNTADDHDRRANHYRALEWIRDHTPRDAVVGSSERSAIALIPTVTGRWSFVPFGLRTSAPLAEILGRYFSIAKLEGKSWDEIASTWRFSQFERLWVETYFVLFHNSNPPFDAVFASAKKAWDTFDPAPFIASRQLDYVLTKAATSGIKLFESGNWKVIEIQHARSTDVTMKRVSP